MLQRSATLTFLALLLGSLVWLGMRTTGLSAVAEVVPGMVPDVAAAGAAPGALRGRARAASSCDQALPLWLQLLDAEDPDDLEALHGVAACARYQGIDRVVDKTATLFEDSRVLSALPAVLETLALRERVPILNDVTPIDLDAAAMHRIGQWQQRLGDPEAAARSFAGALNLDPANADVRFDLAYSLIARGEIDGARREFQLGLAGQAPTLRLVRVYAVAVAWPLPFSLLVLAIVGLGATLATRRRNELVDTLLRALGEPDPSWLGAGLVAGVTLTMAGLLVWFALTADRVAFVLIALCTVGALGWMLSDPLRRPAANLLRQLVRLASGRIYRQLARLGLGPQLGLLLLSGGVLVFVLPLIHDADMLMATAFLALMLLFSTVGAILLVMLQHSGSLRATLRWLAVGGTLPYLAYFLYVDRRYLIAPLTAGEWLPPQTQTRLAGYLIVWVLGLAFALLLSRILSKSILDPVDRVMAALQRVRAGDYTARSEVDRRDEIGTLALAVDDLALGLAHRERIHRTFKRYIDQTVAERLLAGDSEMERPRLIQATVLFSDLRGFTAVSEVLEPEQVVTLLNDYFARMAPIVQRWGGVVDKFLGDGMLAVWDVPEPRTTGWMAGVPGPQLAVGAAWEMLQAIDGVNVGLRERGLPEVTVGIGVHCGPLTAGPVGSPERREYTVIGDTVNTAARVESVARGDTPLLVTAEVAAQLEGVATVEVLPPVRLKGKAEAVAVCAVREVEAQFLGLKNC